MSKPKLVMTKSLTWREKCLQGYTNYRQWKDIMKKYMLQQTQIEPVYHIKNDQWTQIPMRVIRFMNWSDVVRFQDPLLTSQEILACWQHIEILKIQLFQLIYWHSVTSAVKGFLLAHEPTPYWMFSECCVTVTVGM